MRACQDTLLDFFVALLFSVYYLQRQTWNFRLYKELGDSYLAVKVIFESGPIFCDKLFSKTLEIIQLSVKRKKIRMEVACHTHTFCNFANDNQQCLEINH